MARRGRRRSYKRDAKGRFARTGRRLAKGAAIAGIAVAVGSATVGAGAAGYKQHLTRKSAKLGRENFALRGQVAKAKNAGRKVR